MRRMQFGVVLVITILISVLLTPGFVYGAKVKDPVYKMTWKANEHIYQLVYVSTPVSWHEANDLASQMFVTYKGAKVFGHLVTITSAEEEAFIEYSLIPKLKPDTQDWTAFWIGASDESEEGNWSWINEEGQFWQGLSWDFTPIEGAYNNWNLDGGQPDNFPFYYDPVAGEQYLDQPNLDGEDFGELYYFKPGSPDLPHSVWNDAAFFRLNYQYIVEYDVGY